MSFISRKRPLSDCSDFETDEPPQKKQKLDNNSSTMISSILFHHHFDHKKFQQIFKSIDGSDLIKSLNITHFINKEIAEFANGQFKECGNGKCENKISVLHQDKEIYDNDHKNANKLGYKWCCKSNKYYCSECMNDTKSCKCDCIECELKYIPECNKCELCQSILLGHKCCFLCDYDECWEYKCNGCDVKRCGSCYGLRDCIECDKEFCSECMRIKELVGPYNDDDGICNGCYDESYFDKIIECNKCNLKCKLLFKSNKYLYGVDDGNDEMIKCGNKDCDIFVCLSCDEEERNGKDIICDESDCNTQTAIRCNKHIFDKEKCWKHEPFIYNK